MSVVMNSEMMALGPAHTRNALADKVQVQPLVYTSSPHVKRKLLWLIKYLVNVLLFNALNRMALFFFFFFWWAVPVVLNVPYALAQTDLKIYLHCYLISATFCQLILPAINNVHQPAHKCFMNVVN